jgi:RNA polymerase sigma factor (sigma-70 family)
MLDRMGAVRDDNRFCRWVRMVARNLTLDHLRRLKRFRNELNEPYDERSVQDKRPQASPAQKECIERIYEQMPERSRQVYDLTVEGAKREEVAKTLGIEVRAVYWHLSKIRQSLAPCWGR